MPQRNFQTQQMVGKEWTSDELVNYLKKFNDFFQIYGGGITFSGGEPTMQAEFILECLQKMPGVHTVLDTSGYCEESLFAKLSKQIDVFYFDLKLADEEKHLQYTGVSNKRILNNLKWLMNARKKVTIRIPMIPHITDTEDNLHGLFDIIVNECPNVNLEIHLLPYNTVAGGKYPIYQMKYPLSNSYCKNNTASILNFQKTLEENGYQVTNYV